MSGLVRRRRHLAAVRDQRVRDLLGRQHETARGVQDQIDRLFGLFFSSAIYPLGSFLMQTRMGALATVIGPLIAVAVARSR